MSEVRMCRRYRTELASLQGPLYDSLTPRPHAHTYPPPCTYLSRYNISALVRKVTEEERDAENIKTENRLEKKVAMVKTEANSLKKWPETFILGSSSLGRLSIGVMLFDEETFKNPCDRLIQMVVRYISEEVETTMDSKGTASGNAGNKEKATATYVVKVGDRGQAHYGVDADEKWFDATVTAVNEQAQTCDVRYSDGDKEMNKPWARVRRLATVSDRGGGALVFVSKVTKANHPRSAHFHFDLSFNQKPKFGIGLKNETFMGIRALTWPGMCASLYSFV